jgi:hypothetical protein
MTIELSDLTFTDQDDVVPASGVFEVILNTGIANTLDGNDSITSSGIGNDGYGFGDFGFKNAGILNTDDGNDTITGSLTYGRFGNNNGFNFNIVNFGTLNTGDGNDMINGSHQNFGSYAEYGGIYNSGTLNTGGGNDTITGYGTEYGFLSEDGTLNTEDGNDIITFSGRDYGILLNRYDFSNFERSTLNTGEGNDIIIGIGSKYGITNGITVNTGNGQDSIISEGGFINYGKVVLGYGNDSIVANAYYERALDNKDTIETGDGNDTITITGVIYNEGVINTGDGDDSIIVDGGFDEITGAIYGIYNNGGVINMGDGNDSIIANEVFKSGANSSEAWFLGEGDDYIKGFGSGDFYGGRGNDTLELTPGTYTVGIWGEAGESPIFTKDDQLMITSEFEKLKAGSTIYDFTSLTAGQIIVVA